MLRVQLSHRPPADGWGTLQPGGPGGGMLLERGGQSAYVHMPADAAGPFPLLIVLHGAGKDKMWELKPSVAAWADRSQAHNMIVLYPSARGSTWDYISSKRAARADVEFIEWALNSVRHSALPVDDERIALIGISDGGSMALSLAAHNPALFQAAISVSAGFCADPPPATPLSPRLLLMHGSEDKMFPLSRVGNPLQEKIKRLGYSVDFRIARGQGHVPPGWQDDFLPTWLAMAPHSQK